MPCRFDGSFGGFAEQGFEFCKYLFDRIEVGAIGRQEEELGADRANGAPHGLSLVAAEIVHDDDVAGGERRHEELLDIGQEAFAVDRPIEDEGSVDPVAAQRRKKGQCPPVALRRLGQQFVSPRRPATKARHIRLGPSLVDEDQPRRIKPALMRLPAPALARDVGTILLGGEQCFF